MLNSLYYPNLHTGSCCIDIRLIPQVMVGSTMFIPWVDRAWPAASLAIMVLLAHQGLWYKPQRTLAQLVLQDHTLEKDNNIRGWKRGVLEWRHCLETRDFYCFNLILHKGAQAAYIDAVSKSK